MASLTHITDPRPSHRLLLVTKSLDSVKMGASHDSYGASDSLPSPWPNLRGLLFFFSNTNKLLRNIKANKRTVVPRSSPEVLLKNLGTKGSVPTTGTPLLGLSRDGAGGWTAGYTPASQPKPELKA